MSLQFYCKRLWKSTAAAGQLPPARGPAERPQVGQAGEACASPGSPTARSPSWSRPTWGRGRSLPYQAACVPRCTPAPCFAGLEAGKTPNETKQGPRAGWWQGHRGFLRPVGACPLCGSFPVAVPWGRPSVPAPRGHGDTGRAPRWGDFGTAWPQGGGSPVHSPCPVLPTARARL